MSKAKRSRPFCRRQFLRGAGVSIGLPFLPSLATSQAYAQDPVFPREKFFYALRNNHGGALESSMFPGDSVANQQTQYASAGHIVRHGQLPAQMQGNNTVISSVLTAPTSALSAAMVRKLNVIRGLDSPMKIGHNNGGVLGNFQDSTSDFGIPHRPTIDQIMAYSPSFYRDTAPIRLRSMPLGPCWGYSNPTAQSGTVQRVSLDMRSQDLFDRVFAPKPAGPPGPEPRKPIVDRILENYRRLRNGNQRLSMTDRQRLDDHISRLGELEKLVGSTNTPSARACENRPRPTQGSQQFGDGYSYGAPTFSGSYRDYARVYNEVFAVAFACGTSRIAVMDGGRFADSTFSGSWHQDVAHNYQSRQPLIVAHYREFFEFVFLDLANRLNSIPTTPGRTVLDDSLMMWTQESGMNTHYPISIPIITAGGAGGAVNTGNYIDYRNKERNQFYQVGGVPVGDQRQYFGLTYNQFLASTLQSMGVGPAEYERWGHKGYGAPGYGNVTDAFPEASIMNYYGQSSSKYFQIASEKLPVFMA